MHWRSFPFFWLLLAVAAVEVVLIVALRRRREQLRAFADANLVMRLTPGVDQRRRQLRVALRLVTLMLLVFALAGPKWGFHWEEVRRQGIDLLVAIDTSRSMLATDVKPNRLERAKLAVLDLVKLMEGDRVGLVPFAGSAFLECPLTLDRAAFERSLRAIHVGIIPRGGTALARAIDTSLEGFEARQGKYEVLILITDGEDHEGDVEEAAKRAAERGVKIYTVGIGTTEGELIPAGDGGERGYVKDRQGQVVKSRLNEAVLQQIAMATGGAYVRGTGASLGLDEVFRDHIAKMERREVSSTLERRYEERFQIPLALALIFFLAEAVTGERKRAPLRRWRWWPRRARAPEQVSTTAFLLVLLPLLVGWFDAPGDRAAEGNRLYAAGKYAEAADRYGEGLVDAPRSPLLQFNRGAALYKQGKYAEAIEAWTKVAASGEEEWIARAAYNLGNAQYQLGSNAEQGDPQAAIASYVQALASYKRAMGADSQDEAPKFNHELVEHRLSELKRKLEEEKKRQEEQRQEEQEQQREQGQEDESPQEQQQEQATQEPQQPDGAEQREERQDQEQAAEQPQPEEGQQQEQAQPEEQQAAGGEPAAGEEPQRDLERQAAQAVIDVARDEELGPEDIQRPAGVAGVVEPAQDW
jgi:Ca-activated chloride channel family protein